MLLLGQYDVGGAGTATAQSAGLVVSDGTVAEERQPHMRGGRKEPLTRADIEEKFRLNCAYGGWPAAKAEEFLSWVKSAWEGRIDLARFR